MANKYLDKYRDLYSFDLGGQQNAGQRRKDSKTAQGYDSVASYAPGVGTGIGAGIGGLLGLFGGPAGAGIGATIGGSLGGAAGSMVGGFANNKSRSLTDPHEEEEMRRQAMANALMSMINR